MIGIDTNILVRYLVNDPPTDHQVQQAIQLVDHALQREEQIFLNNVVICETVWVLSYHYKVARNDLSHALGQLFHHPGFVVENRSLLNQALTHYCQKRIDFADCLIAMLNRKYQCQKTYSFDKQAIKQLGFIAP